MKFPPLSMLSTSISTSRWRQCSLVNKRAASPNGSPSWTPGAPFKLGRAPRGQLMPASKKVMRQVSRGMYSRRRDPDATNSTTASERPARCRKGKNCFDLARSWKRSNQHLVNDERENCGVEKILLQINRQRDVLGLLSCRELLSKF